MIKYQTEVKASDASARLGRWAHPVRLWVRGYNESGERVYSEHIGFADGRCRGPRSGFFQVLQRAEARAEFLNSKPESEAGEQQ